MLSKRWKSLCGYFTKGEIALWCVSVALIHASFFMFDRENFLTFAASLIGVTSLIFNAKGNPFGQFLMVIFSILYGVISFTFSYYGEMITYLGMTAPMAVFALVSWLRNPYNGNKAEVKVNRLKCKEIIFMILLTLIVTFIFYYILSAFHTANLILSTLSVTTSFLAVYLTFRRSAFFAIAYAANDIVLIVLWILATFSEISYLSVVICFVIFLVNDIYGFISWSKMRKRQETDSVWGNSFFRNPAVCDEDKVNKN
ncbi:MAG: nicotinamide riboside transporter PnuC [Lachnospiraceae bacterium]|nr:nicotinamide riboside transporter PnuC [Lachnospiraceae bacterium]